jgi:tRNA (guanosine-2'-O-)-methyltransferase
MIEELLKTYPKEDVIKHLEEFLTRDRIERIDLALSKRIQNVEVAIESPYDIHNGLAVVRTAEALGVSHVNFINAIMKKGQGKNTTKGTLKWVHLERSPSIESFLEERDQVFIAGACADGEMSLDDLPIDQPICFLFGNEKEGLSKKAKAGCNALFHVPMYGMVESLNLSVACAITLYDYLKRKRKALSKEGDLPLEQLVVEKACFYIRSLGIEQASEILKRRFV